MISTKPNGTSFIAVERVPQQMRVAVTCHKCQRQEVGRDKPQAPFHLLVKHFKERGWALTQRGTHAVCPECQRRARVIRPVLSDHDAEIAFARQREAEEMRIGSEKSTQQQAAEAFSTPAARTIDDVVADCLAHLAKVPMHPARPGMRSWRAGIDATAAIVAEYIRADHDGRDRIYEALIASASAVKTCLPYFARGMVSDGSRAWPEMREKLLALGVEPLAGPVRTNPRTKSKPKMETAITTTTTTMPTTFKDEPSREARRAQAKMFSLLEAHFTVPDGSNIGTYDDNWSDERIASESGLSPAEVARTREQVYGAVIDPRVVDLEAQIAAARAEFVREAEDIKSMLELLRKQMEGRISGLTQALAAIKARR